MVNPLTHCYFSLKLTEGNNLNKEEQDFLIVGSILPDIHLSGLIEYHKTHTNGKEFFGNVAKRLHQISALAIIMHAEKPFGIDHYTHKWEGFICKNSKEVENIAKRYENVIGKVDAMTIHHLTEFTIDHILALKNPELTSRVKNAFKNDRTNSVITAFASFHGMSERKNKKIISILKSKHVMKFIENFSTLEGTTQNWLSLKFYRDLKEGKSLSIKEKLKRMTKFSILNIKRKINDDKLCQMFQEMTTLLDKRSEIFLKEVEKKVMPLKDEYWSNIHD